MNDKEPSVPTPQSRLLKELKASDGCTEIILSEPLCAGDLMLFLDLPYEVGITEQDGILILTTNPDQPSLHVDAFTGRLSTSKVSLHTHNKKPDIKVNSPSFQDILQSPHLNPLGLILVAHEDGITQYGPPVKSAISDKKPPYPAAAINE